MYFRYVQQKRIKALEAESKLKQVFVPNYTNKSTRLTGSNGEIIIRGKDCDAYPNLAKVMNIFSWNQFHEIFAKLNSCTLLLPKIFVYLLVYRIILIDIWKFSVFLGAIQKIWEIHTRHHVGWCLHSRQDQLEHSS